MMKIIFNVLFVLLMSSNAFSGDNSLGESDDELRCAIDGFLRKFDGFSDRLEDQLRALDDFYFKVKVDSDLSEKSKIQIFDRMLIKLGRVPLDRSFQQIRILQHKISFQKKVNEIYSKAKTNKKQALVLLKKLQSEFREHKYVVAEREAIKEILKYHKRRGLLSGHIDDRMIDEQVNYAYSYFFENLSSSI